jgi:hypothetical protein
MRRMPPPALVAELLYAEPVAIDLEALAARLPEGSRLADEDRLLIAHEQVFTTIADGTRVPLLTFVTPAEPREYDLSQTHGCDGAPAAVERAHASVLLAEMMGHLHAREHRRAAFRSVVTALLAMTDPVATWWPNACKLVPPAEAADHGFVNVRLFNVQDEPDEMVMDSLGLHVFGLPDVQCRFRDLEPGRVAAQLYDLAARIFERGGDGDGNALVAPERAVIDAKV